jgi:hypothetical protein
MMKDSSKETFLNKQQSEPGTGSWASRPGELPADVLSQSAKRLRVLALLYAFIFFMAGFFPSLLGPEDRAFLVSTPRNWAPGVVSIIVALLVAAATRRVPLHAVTYVGLTFEVVSSFGIAAAEFLTANALPQHGHWVGLSWVAVWTLLFTVVVPAPPRHSALATIASVSAVPITIGYAIVQNARTDIEAQHFFFGFTFPYMLVAAMAYVGSRVVYALGAEVTRARELGSYQLVERLGQGGMGEVWRAKHRLLARPAAIKLVRPEVLGGSDSERQQLLLRRFEREVQATAAMRSPHTIQLLDGFDLDTLIVRFGPVPAERASHLLRQVCRSLAEAHAAGLIHRDVKPANVYVCRYGREADFVKVLDFGMVKSQDEGRPGDSALTGDHIAGGTPAFMAPEQVLGNRPIDGRTDIYAVGCLAYWLVTGQLVFSGRNAMETMMLHTHQKPEAPSKRTELPIPEAFDRLVLRCLEKNPDDRPSTADALAEELCAIIPKGTWRQASALQWWEKHRPVEARNSGNGSDRSPAGSLRT